MATVSPSFTCVSRARRYRTSSSFTYTFTNRCSPPSPVTRLPLMPGYLVSMSSIRSPRVRPRPSMVGRPPTCARRRVGTFTVTGIRSRLRVRLGSVLRLGRCLRRRQPAERVVVDERGDRWVRATHGALRIPSQVHRREVHGPRVEEQETADQRLPGPGDQLDRLDGLDRSDDTGEDT